jgi:hypothetical protein
MFQKKPKTQIYLGIVICVLSALLMLQSSGRKNPANNVTGIAIGAWCAYRGYARLKQAESSKEKDGPNIGPLGF